MKTILFTQRVFIKADYSERWDAADQRITALLAECGFLPLPAPNRVGLLGRFVEKINPSGLVLTGGNSLVKYGGDAPERDAAEAWLVEYFSGRNLPIFGFCRGMQILLDYFGGELRRTQGHVAVRHAVSGRWGTREVNSYHDFTALSAPTPLTVTMTAEDGTVEAVEGAGLLGMMWHPERETPFDEEDVARIKNFFG